MLSEKRRITMYVVPVVAVLILIGPLASQGRGDFPLWNDEGFTGAHRVMLPVSGSDGNRDASFSLQSDTHLMAASSIEPRTVAVFTVRGVDVGFGQEDFVDQICRKGDSK